MTRSIISGFNEHWAKNLWRENISTPIYVQYHYMCQSMFSCQEMWKSYLTEKLTWAILKQNPANEKLVEFCKIWPVIYSFFLMHWHNVWLGVNSSELLWATWLQIQQAAETLCRHLAILCGNESVREDWQWHQHFDVAVLSILSESSKWEFRPDRDSNLNMHILLQLFYSF